MARITLSHLAHTYIKKPRVAEDYALKELNLEWQDGKAYALLGPSGCGKTTLLNIISGLVKPWKGKILFDEREVTSQPTAQRNIAQVFQFPVVYDTMTVRENLAFPLKNRGMTADYIERRTREIAQMIGMEGVLEAPCHGLNADIKQKISLGRGMVREDVNAILFDEPLTVIDPHMKWELRTQLRRLHETFGHTMIYVTHDQTEALTFADEVVVMYEGQVVQSGTPEELFEKPQHRFVGFFIGSPGMNFISCKVNKNKAFLGKYEFDLGKDYGVLGDDVVMGVRPEYVELSENENNLPIEIERIEDVGHHKIVRFRVAKDIHDGDLSAIVPESTAITDRMNYVGFSNENVNIYEKDWRVKGI